MQKIYLILILIISTISWSLSIKQEVVDGRDQSNLQILRKLKGQTQKLSAERVGGWSKAGRTRGIQPPRNLRFINEGHRSMGLRYDLSPEDQGVIYYSYAIGGLDKNNSRYPAEIMWWTISEPKMTGTYIFGVSLPELQDMCKKAGYPELKIGDSFYYSMVACSIYGYQYDSAPVMIKCTITDEELGNVNNTYNFTFGNKYSTPQWDVAVKDSISRFLTKMIPIMREFYGAPARSSSVGIMRDADLESVNMYMADPNEVWCYKFDPQLLTHELLHGMRDFAALSTDSWWHYNDELTVFEEAFAQAISYQCMNEYAKRYPNDEIYGKPRVKKIYESEFEWWYDFANSKELTTTLFFSAGLGDATGIGWRRYQMANSALHKIIYEDKYFAKHFNEEYYKRLNGDPDYFVGREAIIDIMKTVLTKYGKNGATVEGKPLTDWLGQHRIFDSFAVTGSKVHFKEQYLSLSSNKGVEGKFFYYHTGVDGDEFAQLGSQGKWYYHRLNGAKGVYKLYDANNNLLVKKIVQSLPTEQPNPDIATSMKMAYASVDIASADFDRYMQWKGKDYIDGCFSQVNKFGLYRQEVVMDHQYGDLTTNNSYIMLGENMGDFYGVVGGVVDDVKGVDKAIFKSGKIWFKHENLAEEGPFNVVDGAFSGTVSWCGIKDGSNFYANSTPGRVKVRFLDSKDNKEYLDYRTILYGNWYGSQQFLFRVQDMIGYQREMASLESEVQKISNVNNYPNPFNPTTKISFNLKNSSYATISVFNAKGEIVYSADKKMFPSGDNAIVFDGSKLNSGLYFYQVKGDGYSYLGKMILIK